METVMVRERSMPFEGVLSSYQSLSEDAFG
jgi:hypothetical protein